MITQQALSSIGLTLDILGCILLFYNGTPSRAINTYSVLEESLSEESVNHNRKIDRFARLGLILLIIGFVFQFISVVCFPISPIQQMPFIQTSPCN